MVGQVNMFENKVYRMDCVEGCKKLESNLIDLVLTSPPYEDARVYSGKNTFNLENLAIELLRVTKPGGIVVWIVADITRDFNESGASFVQALKFKEFGFNLLDTMIWYKPNPMFVGKTARRYNSAFEYMFVFSKGRPNTFNPIMEDCKDAGRVHTSSNGNMNRLTDKRKDYWGAGNVCKDKKISSNVFFCSIGFYDRFTREHPATFPLDLANKHIYTWTNENDLVLDPFCGSGTSLVSAMQQNRRYIGFDISEEYVKISENRITYYKEKKGLSNV